MSVRHHTQAANGAARMPGQVPTGQGWPDSAAASMRGVVVMVDTGSNRQPKHSALKTRGRRRDGNPDVSWWQQSGVSRRSAGAVLRWRTSPFTFNSMAVSTVGVYGRR